MSFVSTGRFMSCYASILATEGSATLCRCCLNAFRWMLEVGVLGGLDGIIIIIVSTCISVGGGGGEMRAGAGGSDS